MEMVTPFRIFVNDGVKIGLGLLFIWSAFRSSFSFFRASTGAFWQSPLILTPNGGIPRQTADHWMTITCIIEFITLVIFYLRTNSK
jgi:hypothetical protein